MTDRPKPGPADTDAIDPSTDATEAAAVAAYPAPPGYAEAKIEPVQAAWNAGLGEFLLDYDTVRAAPDPQAVLLSFCQWAYDAAADLAQWDRTTLECPLGRPGIPRTV